MIEECDIRNSTDNEGRQRAYSKEINALTIAKSFILTSDGETLLAFMMSCSDRGIPKVPPN